MKGIFNRSGKISKRGGDKMKKIFRIAVCSLGLALMLSTAIVMPAMAATSAPITISATPAYIAMTVDHDTWTLNGLTGAGTIVENTTYFSNPLGDTAVPSDPVVDAECYFGLTNTSTVTTDVFANMANFTGGSATMTNSNDGSNGATTFGSYSYCTGMTYSSGKVICKSSGSAATKTSLAPTTNIKLGFMIKTRTNAWAGGTASTSVVTVSLAAH